MNRRRPSDSIDVDTFRVASCPGLTFDECAVALETADKSMDSRAIKRFCGRLNALITTYYLNFRLRKSEVSPSKRARDLERIKMLLGKLCDALEVESGSDETPLLTPICQQAEEDGFEAEVICNAVQHLAVLRDVTGGASQRARDTVEKNRGQKMKRYKGNPHLDDLIWDIGLLWVQTFRELPGISVDELGRPFGPYFRFLEG